MSEPGTSVLRVLARRATLEHLHRVECRLERFHDCFDQGAAHLYSKLRVRRGARLMPKARC